MAPPSSRGANASSCRHKKKQKTQFLSSTAPPSPSAASHGPPQAQGDGDHANDGKRRASKMRAVLPHGSQPPPRDDNFAEEDPINSHCHQLLLAAQKRHQNLLMSALRSAVVVSGHIRRQDVKPLSETCTEILRVVSQMVHVLKDGPNITLAISKTDDSPWCVP